MLHINFSRNVMGLLVLLLLSGLLMAQNEPEFGQVWQKSSLNPVFENIPVPGTWNSGGQSNHSTGKAMWDGENYRVYLACKGPDPDANLSIGVFLSPHLDSGWVAYENNPVFESDSTNWDVLDIGAPYVMKDGDIYKMWYSALNAADVRHIGYAESADGYSWDRHLTPVLSPDLDSDWESDNVMSPFVMKENDSTYFMWYDAKSSGLPWQIGVAQSSDGIQWTRPTPDPVITNAPWTAFWLRFPTVIHTGEKYVMWFGGGPTNVFTTPGRMGTAVSDDGINWRQDDLYNPIMSGETAAWDDLVVLTAGIFYEDDHYRMLYLGTDAEWDHVSIAVADYLPTIVATGDVSGTWTKAGSPYRVEGEISVPDGETLTIEAGTTVEFLNPSPLNVLGRILALGTDDERIRFRVDDTLGIYDDAAMEGVWGGIKFANTPTTNDSSRLSYCDIEFGDSWAGGSNNGGGIKIYNFGKLTVDNCLIQYNRAVRGVAGNYAYGGGICINYNSHPKILNNVIQHNHTNHLLEISGDTGGGIMVYDGSNPLISGNIIRWNRATETGGGLGIWTDSEPMIINNLIVENTALREDGTGGAGGGVATGWDSRPVLINNTIAENVAGWTGGGFYSNDGDAIFINTIIADNEDLDNPDIFGSQIGTWGMAGNTLHIYHSNLEHGVDSINWDGNQVGILDTEALVAQDPSLSSSYHLSFASRPMCGGIDSCEIDGEMYYAPDTDLNGNPRPSPAGTMPDKGCYEELLVDIDDIGSVPTGLQLYQNFPNPFNPITSIRYTLPRPAEVNLVIYDILGQEVATLQSGFQTAGAYHIQWNGINASGLGVSTGMYFCRLQLVDPATGRAGSYSQTIKMVLLR